MLLQTRMMVACLLVLTAAPALGATRKDHADCNARDLDRNIVGCSRVGADRKESTTIRAIAYVGRGLAWQLKGERDRAMADFNDAIRLDPKNTHAYNNRAILWREKGEVDNAIADFTKAIAIDPLPHSDLAGPGHVNLYANRGLAWKAKGDFDRALSDFDEALRQDSKDADARYFRSETLIAKSEYERAIADLDAVISLKPNASAYYLRGAVRYEQYIRASFWIEKEDLARAIADYNSAIRLSPKMADAYHGRALAWSMNGDHDRAVDDAKEAVRLNPLSTEMIDTLKALKPDAEELQGLAGLPAWPPKK
jgi:tetratricopeptide (TPR) repeat protein